MSESIPLFERLIIESHSLCNRACWFCPRTHDRHGKYLDAHRRPVSARMATGKILALMDEARALGFRGPVGFHHYCEPLLDDRCVMLAWEARRRGLCPYVHTNGDALADNPSLCREVVDAYHRVVIGLYDYETNDQLEAARDRWRARLPGADLQFSTIGPSPDRSLSSVAVPRALVPGDPRMRFPDLVYSGAPCHRPLIRLIVQYDGDVCNCCDDTHGAFALGNVHDESLEEIWFSPKHVHLTRDLAAGGRDDHPLCSRCPQSPTGRPGPGERIRIAPRTCSVPSGG